MGHKTPGRDRKCWDGIERTRMGQQPLGWDSRSQEKTGCVRIGHKELRGDRSHQDVTPVTGMGHEAPGWGTR